MLESFRIQSEMLSADGEREDMFSLQPNVQDGGGQVETWAYDGTLDVESEHFEVLMVDRSLTVRLPTLESGLIPILPFLFDEQDVHIVFTRRRANPFSNAHLLQIFDESDGTLLYTAQSGRDPQLSSPQLLVGSAIESNHSLMCETESGSYNLASTGDRIEIGAGERALLRIENGLFDTQHFSTWSSFRTSSLGFGGCRDGATGPASYFVAQRMK